MARDETKRLKPSVVEEDKDSFAGLKTITNYAPANQAYTVAAIGTSQEEMVAAQEAEAQADAALKTARDRVVAGREVGAVARDAQGNLAAATSTGVLTCTSW